MEGAKKEVEVAMEETMQQGWKGSMAIKALPVSQWGPMCNGLKTALEPGQWARFLEGKYCKGEFVPGGGLTIILVGRLPRDVHLRMLLLTNTANIHFYCT